MLKPTYVKVLHRFDVFLRCLGSFRVRIVEFASEKVPVFISIRSYTGGEDLLCNWIGITSTTRLNLPDYFRLNLPITYILHHGQMLQVIMGLKECIAGEEFHQDTANTPDVTGIAPSQVKYNFWCSIMSGRDDRRMILIIESS